MALIGLAFRRGRRALGLLATTARSDRVLFAEFLALRWENAVLRRQIARVRSERVDRAWFAALSPGGICRDANSGKVTTYDEAASGSQGVSTFLIIVGVIITLAAAAWFLYRWQNRATRPMLPPKQPAKTRPARSSTPACCDHPARCRQIRSPEKQSEVNRRSDTRKQLPVLPEARIGAVALLAPAAQEVAMPKRSSVLVGEQRLPIPGSRNMRGEQAGEERRQVDRAAVPALGRAEVPAGVHVVVYHSKHRVDRVPGATGTALPICRATRWHRQMQEGAPHPAHLAPAHPGERRNEDHQRLLRR
jgi:hypothetical protein